MSLLKLKQTAAVAAFALVAMLGTSAIVNSQGRYDRDRKSIKQQQKEDKQNAKAAKARQRADQQRQAYWNARNAQILANQRRIAQRSGNDRSGGAGYIFGNANDNTNRDGRFRVYRGSSYYQTDYRGIEMLRQAVNEGYRQGFQAGRNDRNNYRRTTWANSNVYRTGTYGYQPYVDRNQYQYYFQQGFQRGYQDGSNNRYADGYNGQYDYGYYENGSVNILSTILNTVLNIRSY